MPPETEREGSDHWLAGWCALLRHELDVAERAFDQVTGSTAEEELFAANGAYLDLVHGRVERAKEALGAALARIGKEHPDRQRGIIGDCQQDLAVVGALIDVPGDHRSKL